MREQQKAENLLQKVHDLEWKKEKKRKREFERTKEKAKKEARKRLLKKSNYERVGTRMRKDE